MHSTVFSHKTTHADGDTLLACAGIWVEHNSACHTVKCGNVEMMRVKDTSG